MNPYKAGFYIILIGFIILAVVIIKDTDVGIYRHFIQIEQKIINMDKKLNTHKHHFFSGKIK